MQKQFAGRVSQFVERVSLTFLFLVLVFRRYHGLAGFVIAKCKQAGSPCSFKRSGQWIRDIQQREVKLSRIGRRASSQQQLQHCGVDALRLSGIKSQWLAGRQCFVDIRVQAGCVSDGRCFRQ